MAEMEEEIDQEYLQELPTIKELINDNIIKKLLTSTIFEKNSQEFFLKIYNFVQKYAKDKLVSGILYDYFNETIETCSKELTKELNDKSNSEIIDIFINVANKMEIIIFFLSKTFSFLDFYYVIFENKQKILKCTHEKYKINIFMQVKNQLIEEVNKLLKKDREGERENRMKIKKILNMMKIMDFENPIMNRVNDTIIWDNEIEDEKKETPIQDYWFNLFLKDTEQFVSSKAIQDIQNRSTP